MFDGIKMDDLLGKVQEMQKNIAEKQDEIGKKRIEVSVGGGMIKMIFNGKYEMLSININKDIVDPEDIETLADLIRAGVNQGLRKTKEASAGEMSSLINDIKMPIPPSGNS